MSETADVLVLDDEAIVCERLKDYLEKKDYRIEAFTESRAALDRLAEKEFDAVITDLKMKGPTGLDVLHFVRDRGAATQVIIITGYASMEAAREAEFASVFDFIAKPFQMEKLEALLRKAVRKTRKIRDKGNR